MPAEGAKYKIIRQPLYADALARVENQEVLAEIAAAEDAIAQSPYAPDPPGPTKRYKLLRVRKATSGTAPIGLMVALREVQILRNGYIVKYTIRESGQIVILEDLDLPFLYRFPEFQP